MTTATQIRKQLWPGSVPRAGAPRARDDVHVWVQFDGERLSISGVIGALANGDARGSCGQIDGNFAHRDPADDDVRYGSGLIQARDFEFAQDWNAEMWLRLLDVWKRWHLNDMRAGCEHQRAEGWGERPIDPEKPTTAYGRHFEGQRQDSWNLLGWVRPDEHPEGLLTKECPECGYRYGSSWLREDVPADVLDFLASLPTGGKRCPWSAPWGDLD